jgi:hypothetical protein
LPEATPKGRHKAAWEVGVRVYNGSLINRSDFARRCAVPGVAVCGRPDITFCREAFGAGGAG